MGFEPASSCFFHRTACCVIFQSSGFLKKQQMCQMGDETCLLGVYFSYILKLYGMLARVCAQSPFDPLLFLCFTKYRISAKLHVAVKSSRQAMPKH